MKLKRPNRQQIILAAILILAALLRFYRLPDWLYFTIDEERDAFIMRRILVEHRPVLIGGSIPGGLYIGPGFYYLSAIVMFFSGLNPIGEGVVASLLGVISVYLIYKVGKLLFSRQTALFSSLFYATSYLIVVYNRIYWPLVLAPVIAIISYYSLIMVKRKKWKFVFVLTAVAIIGAQSDPSNFSTLLLMVIFWIYYKLPLNKSVKRGIALFFLSHLSLVLFDLRHNFLNTRALVNFFSFGKQTGSFSLASSFAGLKIIPQVIARTLAISGPLNISQQINPCDQYQQARTNINPAAWWLAISTLVFFVFNWFKNKRHLGYKLIGTHLAIAVLGVIFYNIFFPGYTNEWFFYVLFPAFSLIIGLALTALWRRSKIICLLLVSSFIIINLHSLVNTSNDFGFKQKSQAIKYAINQVGDKPFYLDSLGSCHSYQGARYLFWLYGREPTASYMDPVYGDWLYPHPGLDREDLSLKVVLVSQADQESQEFYRRYQQYLKKTLLQKSFGRIKILIVDD